MTTPPTDAEREKLAVNLLKAKPELLLDLSANLKWLATFFEKHETRDKWAQDACRIIALLLQDSPAQPATAGVSGPPADSSFWNTRPVCTDKNCYWSGSSFVCSRPNNCPAATAEPSQSTTAAEEEEMKIVPSWTDSQDIEYVRQWCKRYAESSTRASVRLMEISAARSDLAAGVAELRERLNKWRINENRYANHTRAGAFEDVLDLIDSLFPPQPTAEGGKEEM